METWSGATGAQVQDRVACKRSFSGSLFLSHALVFCISLPAPTSPFSPVPNPLTFLANLVFPQINPMIFFVVLLWESSRLSSPGGSVCWVVRCLLSILSYRTWFFKSTCPMGKIPAEYHRMKIVSSVGIGDMKSKKAIFHMTCDFSSILEILPATTTTTTQAKKKFKTAFPRPATGMKRGPSSATGLGKSNRGLLARPRS